MGWINLHRFRTLWTFFYKYDYYFVNFGSVRSNIINCKAAKQIQLLFQLYVLRALFFWILLIFVMDLCYSTVTWFQSMCEPSPSAAAAQMKVFNSPFLCIALSYVNVYVRLFHIIYIHFMFSFFDVWWHKYHYIMKAHLNVFWYSRAWLTYFVKSSIFSLSHSRISTVFFYFPVFYKNLFRKITVQLRTGKHKINNKWRIF